MESVVARGIATLLTLLALAFAGTVVYKLFSSNKATNITTDMSLLINNSRAQFSQGSTGYTNFANANLTNLNTAGILPADMVRAAGLTDAWGNAVTLGNAGGATQATIAFGGGNSETPDQCTAVVTALKDYVSLKVGGTTFTQAGLPDPDTAGAACAGSPAIVLTFQ